MTQQPKPLNEIQPEQLALIDQLDARQDDVLLKLDELTHRIEQLIELYLQNRHTENGEDVATTDEKTSGQQRHAA